MIRHQSVMRLAWTLTTGYAQRRRPTHPSEEAATGLRTQPDEGVHAHAVHSAEVVAELTALGILTDTQAV